MRPSNPGNRAAFPLDPFSSTRGARSWHAGTTNACRVETRLPMPKSYVSGTLDGGGTGIDSPSSTLSPCPMCSGTAILFKIPRVVIGENQTFLGAEDWMRSRGIEIIQLNDLRCVQLMERLQREKPDLWAEDIGE